METISANSHPIQFVSWDPRIWVYEDFLTEEECEHLINLGTQQGLTRSKVAAASKGDEENKVNSLSYIDHIKHECERESATLLDREVLI